MQKTETKQNTKTDKLANCSLQVICDDTLRPRCPEERYENVERALRSIRKGALKSVFFGFAREIFKDFFYARPC